MTRYRNVRPVRCQADYNDTCQHAGAMLAAVLMARQSLWTRFGCLVGAISYARRAAHWAR